MKPSALILSLALAGSLSCAAAPREVSFRWDASRFVLEGPAPYPDGTLLLATVHSLTKTLDGRTLVSVKAAPLGKLVMVRDGHFCFSVEGISPGPIRVVLEVPADVQPPQLDRELGDVADRRRWEITLDAWDPGLVHRLPGAVGEAESFIKEAGPLLEGLTSCNPNSPAPLAGLDALLRRIERSGARTLCPAAMEELAATLLRARRQAIACSGRPPTKPDSAEFRTLQSSVEFALNLAEREAEIWLLKEFARSGSRETWSDALRKVERRPEEEETRRDLRRPVRPGEDLRELTREETAARLLADANLLWSYDSAAAIAIYKELLREYPQELDRLRIRNVIQRRAEQED